jgi:phosphatidylethanolamine-binding protein (PEBP) family uncharacterized protein
MEQGKGADGLIVPLTKVASARLALALATAVALLLAGCGGDSEEETGPAQAAGQAAKAPEQAPTGSPSAERQGSAQKRAKSTPAGTEQATSGNGKQAPPISPPKGAPESGLTPEQREGAKVASIALQSPAVLPVANGPAELPAAYTCDGKDNWPELRWGGVPPGTQELVLFAMSLAPVEGKLFFDWALAGIDPTLEGLEAGRLPQGAVVGQNSFGRNGYSICPPQGQAETYFFALYAIPEPLSARPGFDPHALRRRVQEVSRNVGLLPVSYARG